MNVFVLEKDEEGEEFLFCENWRWMEEESSFDGVFVEMV